MSNRDQNTFMDTALQAARSAGDVILRNLGRISHKDISLKQSSDFVTRVDKEAESIILSTIRERFPGHYFLAEETEKGPETRNYRWIIDPLDGTTNYIHQYPAFSVSIALEHAGEVIVGVIHDPLRGDYYTAEKNKGAFFNKTPARVSDIDRIGESLVSTGFPFRRKEIIESYLSLFRSVFLRVSDLRRAGSAALDLAHVACGKCDGFFEIGLSPWDIAAGELMVREAGGMVTDFGGGDEYRETGNIVAGNPTVHAQLLHEVMEVFAGKIDK
jgi:myo-inositol-1(or 4)-monophosphatase